MHVIVPKPGPKGFAAAAQWEQWSSVGQAGSAVSAWGLKASRMALMYSCCGTRWLLGFSVGAREEPPGQTCLVLLPVCKARQICLHLGALSLLFPVS